MRHLRCLLLSGQPHTFDPTVPVRTDKSNLDVMKQYDKRFVSLVSDAGFKAVFACRSNKELLIGLLNHLLPKGVIVSDIVEYCDREQLQDTVKSKKGFLDLICKDRNGAQFIVEVQDECYADFFKRVVYYASGVYHMQLPVSGEYNALRPVYVVSILNYRLRHEDEGMWDTDHIVSHYEFMETRTKEFANQTISITFAELKRFTKTLEQCESDRDILFYWLLHSQSIEEVPDAINGSPFMKRMVTACEYAAFSPEQKLKFEIDMINEFDREYAISQNYAKGKAEGRYERNLELANAMKNKGIPISDIADITGMPEKEIEKL